MSFASIDLETGSTEEIWAVDPRATFMAEVMRSQILRAAAFEYKEQDQEHDQDDTERAPNGAPDAAPNAAPNAAPTSTSVHPLTAILQAVRASKDHVSNALKLTDMTAGAVSTLNPLLPISYTLAKQTPTPLPRNNTVNRAKTRSIEAQSQYLVKKRRASYTAAASTLAIAAKALPTDSNTARKVQRLQAAKNDGVRIASLLRETGHRRADRVPSAADKIALDVEPYPNLAEQIIQDQQLRNSTTEYAKTSINSPRFIDVDPSPTPVQGLSFDDAAVTAASNPTLFNLQCTLRSPHMPPGSVTTSPDPAASFAKRVQHSYVAACLFRLLQRYAIPDSKMPHAKLKMQADCIAIKEEFGTLTVKLVEQGGANAAASPPNEEPNSNYLSWLSRVLLHHAHCIFHAHFNAQAISSHSLALHPVSYSLPATPPPNILPILVKIFGRFMHEAVVKAAVHDVGNFTTAWAKIPLAGGATICVVKGGSGTPVDLYVSSEGVKVYEGEGREEIVMKSKGEVAFYLRKLTK